VRYAWREDRPYSTYLFGFAAARFREASAKEGAVELRFLSPGFTPEQLERIFAGTGEMLRFFERRAGLPYPGARYTQALLPEAPPQEMHLLSVMSESYGRSVLGDPREDYLVAHELAHQWWGNLVTCEDWSDFWLNEGLATYMVAAWKEHHWGPEEYRREMLMARLRYERAAAESASQGKSRPLVFTGWTQAEEMSGPVTYSKGALVLHLLRRELGDAAFWEGLRLYTKTAADSGGVVRTRDLQRAMEKASGEKLGWFFDQWAYGIEPELTAHHRQEPGAVVVEVEQRGQRGEKPWRIGLQIAVETAGERVSRRVVMTRAKGTFRFPVSGPPLSVRIDEGGYLPRTVEHERPWQMLLHQMTHEPDPAGRADALLALSEACTAPSPAAGCGDLPAALRDRAAEDEARVVRQLAERTLQRPTPKPAR
jgi:aminopeptidase N